ncbi:MAG: 50S ribosomal protein L30 [Candidatus Micrarchaeia archaeon]
MLYAVVRVRGRTGIQPDIKHTMELLNLTRINHCVLLKDTPQNRGMLQVCKDYVTWGEVSADVLSQLIKKRGRLLGNKRLTEDVVKQKGYSGFDEFLEALYAGKVALAELGIKKVFRLNPPRKGYGTVKQPYPRGAVGNRGKDINMLLRRMI